MSECIPLCSAADLVEGGRAVPFDVIHGGETCRNFGLRVPAARADTPLALINDLYQLAGVQNVELRRP